MKYRFDYFFNRHFRYDLKSIFTREKKVYLSADRYRNFHILRHLKETESLIIRRNKFRKFPKHPILCIKELSLHDCQIPKFPGYLFPNLERLYFENCTISDPTDFWQEIPKLREVSIKYTPSIKLTESVGNLKDLRRIYIDFGRNSNVKVQKLDSDKIYELPKNFGNLQNLTIISFSKVNIPKFPESFQNLKNLKKLWLSGKFFTELPSSIGELTNLEEIYIQYTNISQLPESIGNLKNLERLFFIGNMLEKLPDSICNLTSLIELDLSKNQITELPADIGNLKNLKNLNLWQNQLTDLPKSIENLLKLRVLALTENRFKSTSPFVQNLKDKSRYLF